MTLRTALYLRHSTDLGKTANQRPEVEQLARARGYEIAAVFEEGASAVKKRPEYDRMMKEAKRGSRVPAWSVIAVYPIGQRPPVRSSQATEMPLSARDGGVASVEVLDRGGGAGGARVIGCER